MKEPGQGHFLLIAAREVEDSLGGPGRVDPQARDPAGHFRAPLSEPQPAPAGVSRQRRKSHVVFDRAAESQPFGLAVLGEEPDSLRDAARRRRITALEC